VTLQSIYYINIHSFAKDKARLMDALDDTQRKKVNAYRREDDALRSLAGWLLMRHIAGDKTVKYTEKGKPYIEGGPFFSVSHSGDYAVAVVSGTAPVGIDIENTEDTRGGKFSALAKAFFHPDELCHFNESPSPRHFYEIWTQKEAFTKMKGDGLSVGLKTFNVLDLAGNSGTGSNNQPYIRLFWDLDPYLIAVCSIDPVEPTADKIVIALQPDAFR
jgi:4'-phosphopantetheinyl transferase